MSKTKHYVVVYQGHVSFQEDYAEARKLANDVGGRVYNLWGFRVT